MTEIALMKNFEEVAVEREAARLRELMEKYPEFFAKKEFPKVKGFIMMFDYMVFLCNELKSRQGKDMEKFVFQKIQEAINTNKELFRVDRHQSVGQALGVIADLIEHVIVLLSNDPKTNICKKIFLCKTPQSGQESCLYYEDKIEPENRFFLCRFFNIKSEECRNPKAIEAAEKSQSCNSAEE